MESVQDQLRALGEKTTHRRPLQDRFSDLLTDEVVIKIKAITDEPVYIVLYYQFDDRPYSGGFSLSRGSFSLKDGLLEEFPYLKKYPRWWNLFDQIEGTNCHLLGIEETDWLLKKSRQHEIKQRLY